MCANFISTQPASAQISLSLSWIYRGTNETGFGIRRATSKNGPWVQIARIPAPTTSYLDTGLNYSTVYYYQIWAYNGAGDSPLSGMAVFKTRPPDHTKPTLRVVSPVYNQRWNNAEFAVKGIARDNVKVSNVFYSLNGGGWNSATTSNNWINWTAQVTLVPGTNHLWTYATDSSGNNSVTNSVNFIYVVTDRLEVNISGLGQFHRITIMRGWNWDGITPSGLCRAEDLSL